ncbi:MAG: single-stranded-DNA-specific exonuclease RecJ [Gracilibacteraceae bacterium]|jgi:single-stranded-DNA-specific exonuclease|nr:single-stranded-DNA-specific exonuclease RecJ [Gracilibacteraceae bacterium]
MSAFASDFSAPALPAAPASTLSPADTAERRWLLPPAATAPPFPLLARYGVPPAALALMARRGLRDEHAALDYLAVTPGDLHSPFLFRDMGKIIARLEAARRRGEKVLVYGDYDVDGVTATAMLRHVLRAFGLETIVYIPTRQEGYGLHAEVLDKCRSQGVTIVITVDCGVTAVAEALLAREAGIDLIITDHHEPGPELPAAAAILNPRVDSGYPFGYLAGVGVAFKLVQAIYARLTPVADCLPESAWLDLVALGTIADIVPLNGENRVLTKLGLIQMARTEHIGLRALLAECNLSGKQPSAGQIAFLAAPRVNAAGRMDSARLALNLFLAREEAEAQAIARELSRENNARQEVERGIVAELKAELAQGELPPVIVRSSPDWPHGVIGIVASKIAETYRHPVYLIAEEGARAKGSARGALSAYSVVEELQACAAELEHWGGHRAAGGFSLATERIPALRAALNERSGAWRDEVGIDLIRVDAVLRPREVTAELAAMLEIMAPFGAANPTPLFCTRDLTVLRVATFGEEAHLRLDLEGEGIRLTVKAFRRGAEAVSFRPGAIVDILYTLEINSYQGREELQLYLRDYRPANGAEGAADGAAEGEKSTADGEKAATWRLDREQLVDFYRRLLAAQTANGGAAFRWETGNVFALPETEMLKIFFELGLLEWLGGANPYRLKAPAQTTKLDLNRSLRFRYWHGER